jgi:hypothetical protein
MIVKCKIGGAVFALFVTAGSLSAFTPYILDDDHTETTNNALNSIYGRYGYGPQGSLSYRINMRTAIIDITTANAKTDIDNKTKEDPKWHCDNELLSECSNLVKSETAKGIEQIINGNMSEARKTIGAVTHTLQDFYSHSNWIEKQGYAAVNNEMGYGDISNLAQIDDDTCAVYLGAPGECEYSQVITTDRLTSGYYAKPWALPNINKCIHGGARDALSGGGINKDTSYCTYSPHQHLHKTAAAAAYDATVLYFENVLKTLVDKKGDEVGNELFRQFLGFNPDLGFAIDVTTSMTQEIDGVKRSVSYIVNNKIRTGNEPQHYVLSLIDDPDVPEPMVTIDPELFISKLSELKAGYIESNVARNWDCAEYSGLGTYNAVTKLGTGATLFVFTDAAAKDHDMVTKAEELAKDKNIKIINALSVSGSSSCSQYDAKYFEMSETTGGQTFIIDKSEAGNISDLADMLLDDYLTSIMTTSDTLKTGAGQTYSFKVDSQTDKIYIMVTNNGNTLNTVLAAPNNAINDVNSTVLSSSVVYRVNNPTVGLWNITLSGKGTASMNVLGSSPFTFNEFDFVKEDEHSHHPGSYAKIEGFPVAESLVTIKASLSDIASDVSFEIKSKNGTLIDTILGLEPADRYNSGETVYLHENFTIPNEDFVVYAFGKDKNGVEFQRVIPQKVAPQTVSIETISSGDIPLNVDTTYTFRVTNSGNKSTFKIDAADNKGYVVSTSLKTISLEAGEYADVDVVLNPGSNTSAVGAVSVLTLTVVPASSSKIGNYAVVEATVTKEKQHRYPWYRPLKLRNIQP